MNEENMKFWNALRQPPANALKQIQGGRLKGKTDINPQWRYQAMTEQFGVCGIGWKYDIVKTWTEPGPDSQVFANAQINLFIKVGGTWSEAIPGLGGSMLIVKESSALHANDEAYKMAVTDALGKAMKMLGVGADIYAGLWDGSKFIQPSNEPPKTGQNKPAQRDPNNPPFKAATKEQLDQLEEFKKKGKNIKSKVEKFGWPIAKLSDLSFDQADKLIKEFSSEVKA